MKPINRSLLNRIQLQVLDGNCIDQSSTRYLSGSKWGKYSLLGLVNPLSHINSIFLDNLEEMHCFTVDLLLPHGKFQLVSRWNEWLSTWLLFWSATRFSCLMHALWLIYDNTGTDHMLAWGEEVLTCWWHPIISTLKAELEGLMNLHQGFRDCKRFDWKNQV